VDLNIRARTWVYSEGVYEEVCKGQSQQTAESMCCVLGVEPAFLVGKPAEQYVYQRVMSCCSLESFI